MLNDTGLMYFEILARNAELKKTLSGEPYRIAILSNIISSQLNEILEYTLRSTGINAEVISGSYDNIVQDSQQCDQYHTVIIFWETSNIIEGAQYKINLMSTDEIAEIENKIKPAIELTFKNLSKSPLVLFNQFSSAAFNSNNLENNAFDHFCQALNRFIEDRCPPNFRIIDLTPIFLQISLKESIDFRYLYSSKSLYTVRFYQKYVEMIHPFIRMIRGQTKKALIFDCDNTLWNGILGEDGMEGIDMSPNSDKGRIFAEVQSLALDLNRKGVLLGICSKNNFEDVTEVLNHHPDMQIKEKHISIQKVNWKDKVINLQEIAHELNIGLDSFVFVDDSDFEISLVRERIPEITVVKVPEKLYDYPSSIREIIPLFYQTSKSIEDTERVKIYQQQQQREVTKQQFSSLEDYLQHLELKIKIYENPSNLIPRIAQLTQKTNQFNLTTKRYTETQIESYISNKIYKIWAFEVLDKFGTSGITGVCIGKYVNSKKMVIDSFLMSCRVIGRNIEFAFFNFLINFLKQQHIDELESSYLKTPKNTLAAEFYDKLGFQLLSQMETEKSYRLKLEDYQPHNLFYIMVLYGIQN